jgi:uncharacterized iron-regulated membrane protein
VKNNFILQIHAVAGMVAGFFILLMSLSGAILVFHEEVDRLQTPAIENISNSSYSVDKSYVALQQRYPRAQISNCELPYSLTRAIRFTIYDSSYKDGKAALNVFQNPQITAILKTSGSDTGFISWLSKFHNSFHLGKTGEWLLGFFALIFLLSLITGLILFRKNIIAALLFRKTVFRKNNLHQIVGVYALLFNLMIAITGFWMQRYVFKKEFYAADNYTPVLKTSPALAFNFDSAYAAVKNAYPDFTAAVIYFAQSNSGKTAVYGSRSSNGYIHSKKFADAIFLDSTGGIAKTRFVNEISAGDRYDIINSQLHMGRFGGLGIKIIYFVFGLSGGLLSITGFLLWLRRRKRK